LLFVLSLPLANYESKVVKDCPSEASQMPVFIRIQTQGPEIWPRKESYLTGYIDGTRIFSFSLMSSELLEDP
jgi:hypothetical protein